MPEVNYLAEFLTLAGIQLVALISPGPDFAIVLRQSLAYGKKSALLTSLGISAGILLHIAYTLLGIGLIISQSVIAFTILKIFGAAYLIYIGYKAIRSKGHQDIMEGPKQATSKSQSNFKAFGLGFLTNALNPKVTLTFLSLFSVVVSPQTPVALQMSYGLWIALVSGVWFTILTFCFTRNSVKNFFKQFGQWIDRTTGVLLVGLGLKLALTKAS